MLITRPATNAEIFSHGLFVTYSHGAVEYTDRRTESGVAHRTRTRGKIRDDNGVPYVLRRDRKERLHATHYTLPSGRTFLADFRV
tara:strand:- start:836 stop:1090 length:255 start_codon:yes stop_codon:yes gene_type:complete